MNKKEKERYKNQRPIGVMCLSNWGGIEVLDIEYGFDDYVIWRENYGEPQKAHRSKIHYGVNKTTFRAGRMTIDFAEVMRV